MKMSKNRSEKAPGASIDNNHEIPDLDPEIWGLILRYLKPSNLDWCSLRLVNYNLCKAVDEFLPSLIRPKLPENYLESMDTVATIGEKMNVYYELEQYDNDDYDDEYDGFNSDDDRVMDNYYNSMMEEDDDFCEDRY
jgi:hypothetical protein